MKGHDDTVSWNSRVDIPGRQGGTIPDVCLAAGVPRRQMAWSWRSAVREVRTIFRDELTRHDGSLFTNCHCCCHSDRHLATTRHVTYWSHLTGRLLGRQIKRARGTYRTMNTCTGEKTFKANRGSATIECHVYITANRWYVSTGYYMATSDNYTLHNHR